MNFRQNIILCGIGGLLFSGCATSYPATHEEYMQAVREASGFEKSLIYTTDTVVTANYSKSLTNIKKQLKVCIPDQHVEYPVVGSMTKTGMTVTNYKATVNQVSNTKAQVTLRSAQSNMVMQPDDGLILLGADITNLGHNKIRIISSTGITRKVLNKAIIGWSKGSNSCYGIAEKD